MAVHIITAPAIANAAMDRLLRLLLLSLNFPSFTAMVSFHSCSGVFGPVYLLFRAPSRFWLQRTARGRFPRSFKHPFGELNILRGWRVPIRAAMKMEELRTNHHSEGFPLSFLQPFFPRRFQCERSANASFSMKSVSFYLWAVTLFTRAIHHKFKNAACAFFF